ncbi:MAG: amidohydrolase [Desulfurococcales archaeon ex4484_204]|nr:MAG: amidohydrolase [Desulfurococcales archaeon ex4484_204]
MREKVDILINQALIVTMNRDRAVIPRGYVAVREGKIVDVGTGDGLSKYVSEEVVEGGGTIVTPGFICAHTHLYGILLRASVWFGVIEPPTDFQQNLQRIWWAVDEAMNYEDAYASALMGAAEFARTGTTMFKDTFSGPNAIDGVLDRIKKGVDEVGIKGFIAFEATERRSRDEGLRGLRENERFISRYNSDPDELVKGVFSLHASFTVTDDLMVKTKELADKYGARYTMHVEEGLIDVYHNIERYGKRPFERFRDVGFLSPNFIAVHVVQAIDDELELIKQHDVKVAHNPMSNMLNAVGVPPVPKLIGMGVTVGLGNDGYIFDVFENMRSAYLLHKVHLKDPRAMPPLKVVEMATIDAAKVLGVDGHTGSIEVGKDADITIIRPEYVPTLVNEETVYGHLVNTFNGRDVWGVLVRGRWVTKERRLVNVDMGKVMEYVHGVAERLWDRMLKMEPKYKVEYLKL